MYTLCVGIYCVQIDKQFGQVKILYWTAILL